MSKESAIKFLRELRTNEKAKELFEGMEKPTSPDEAIAAYAQVAEKLGYGITVEDIREAIAQEEARRKARNDKVVSDIAELDDDEVEDVAGGGVGPSHGCGSKMREEYEKVCTWLW